MECLFNESKCLTSVIGDEQISLWILIRFKMAIRTQKFDKQQQR